MCCDARTSPEGGTVPAGFSITAQTQPDSVQLTLSGELDLAALADLQEAFARIAADDARRIVRVDLAHATFIDSTMVGALVSARKDAAARGVILTVANARGVVERVLVVTGVYATLRNPDL
jgi:anti-sigma B factor antagonist